MTKKEARIYALRAYASEAWNISNDYIDSEIDDVDMLNEAIDWVREFLLKKADTLEYNIKSKK